MRLLGVLKAPVSLVTVCGASLILPTPGQPRAILGEKDAKLNVCASRTPLCAFYNISSRSLPTSMVALKRNTLGGYSKQEKYRKSFTLCSTSALLLFI